MTTTPATTIAQRVDARGLSCPLPIVRTAIAIKGLQPGDLIEVLATDPGSTKDFTAWAKTTGNELVEQGVEDGVFRFVLRRK
jgi:tRNA 2-thiouridine synthesizing protein A